MPFSFIDFNSVVFLIASLYLWLLFGFLSDTVSCDLKKMFQNPFFRHFTALASIFLLFVLMDRHTYSALHIWKSSFILYLLYILLTKNKWYFAVPILVLMLVDQTFSAEVAHLESINSKNNNDNDKNNKDNKDNKDVNPNIDNYNNYRYYLQYTIITLIVTGFIHYFIRQKNEFKSNFSFYKFIFNTTCKS